MSYGSHNNTHRLTDSSSHRGSKHLLANLPSEHNGVGHNGLNGLNDGLTEALSDGLIDGLIDGLPEDDKDEMLDLNQVQAELMLDVNAQEMMLNEYPADCCPVKFYLNFPCLAGDDDSPFWQGWANLRIKTFRLIENKYFETAVIAMILISSLALVSTPHLPLLETRTDLGLFQAAEDIYLAERPVLQDVLYYMDRIFTVIFTMEMVVKWLALGFVKYFTNAWCWLDFVIVMVRSDVLCLCWENPTPRSCGSLCFSL